MPNRSDPFTDLRELFERAAQRLETAARTWEQDLENRSRLDLSVGPSKTSLDLVDEGDAFVVTVDVPGFEPDDVAVRLTGERLLLSGERDRTVDAADDRYLRREREVASFSRRLRLPEPVETDEIEASLEQGVLTVRLPKRKLGAESRRIEIE
ncbi:Hsp20/alpha crystallin family protein [Halopiger goleimassiliensis]|uniref:Hsp20/alpha crystallin family protein n=1 Tax=Halopiger goleimassiliensis TaxID=1293048 RepID=UPI0006781AB4|nr:Hsp20/alpha crystallin family protein [Halopiger goleimassiliensis]